MAHKSNIVYLQFKLLSTHIRFRSQNGGKDDIREPEKKESELSQKSVQMVEKSRKINSQDE